MKLLFQIIIIDLLLFFPVLLHPLNKLIQYVYEDMACSILVALFFNLVREHRSLPKVLCLVGNCCLLKNKSPGKQKTDFGDGNFDAKSAD